MSNGEWPTEFSAEGGADTAAGLDFGQALLHRKWMLIFFVGLGIAAGLVIHNRTHPVYASYAQLRITRYQPISEGGGKGTARNDLDTYAVLFTSPQIIDKAIKEANLQTLPSLKGPNALNVIRRGLVAEPHEAADEILIVSYSGEHQNDCKKILEAVINAFIADRTDSEQISSTGEINLWRKQKEQLEQDLEQLEQQALQLG